MKQKPKTQNRAQALAALEKLGTVFTVLASPELKVNKAEIAAFGCKQCSTKFGALAISEPFCITCGSDEVEKVESTQVEELESNSELSAITCRSCGEHNIVNSSVAIALGGKAHCVQCGEDITYTPPEEDDITSTEDIDGEGDTTTDGTDTDTTEISDNGEGGDQDLGGDSVAGDEEEPTYSVDANDEGVDMELIDTIPDSEETELSTLLHDGVLIASVNGVPVARLTKEEADVNRDVYTKESFSNAIAHTAGQRGIKDALKHYNFQFIKASFPLKALVDQKVTAALKDKQGEVTAQLKDLREDYTQALQIASLGLAKNFWKGADNALKAGFIEELTHAGVKNPTSVVERVFAHYGQPYIETLLATAEDVLSKSVDVRNQLAETLEATNALSTVEGGNESDEITARLAGANLRPERKKVVTASVTSIREVRDALPGGRLF